MAPVVFVQIVNPKRPGTFLVLAKREFDPAVHTLWTPTETIAPSAATTPAADDTNRPTRDTTAAVDETLTPAKPKRERKPKAPAAPETP